MPVRGSGPRYSDVPVDVLAALVRDPDTFQPQITAWQKAKAEAEEASDKARDERNAALKAIADSQALAREVADARNQLTAEIAAHSMAAETTRLAIIDKQNALSSRSQDLTDFQETLLVRENEVKAREETAAAVEADLTARAARLDDYAASLEAEKTRLANWEASVRANLDDVKSRLAGFQWS